MVENSRLERRLIQGYVRRLRMQYLQYPYYYRAPCETGFLGHDFISHHYEELSQMIGKNGSQEINRNLSKNDINIGAKMFVALNLCPSFYEKLYWKVIYKNQKVSMIAKIASNIIRKAKPDFKLRAKKIFDKMSSVIGFQYIFNHHEGNKSNAMNVNLGKNMLDIKGD